MPRKDTYRKKNAGASFDTLIRFELPPVDVPFQNRGPVRGRRSGGERSLRRHEDDQFLRSQYQFIVPKGTCQFDWNRVVSVCVYDCEDLICPICLQIPAAGRITRCGHIFCFPCILQYFCLLEQQCAKCPVCSKVIAPDNNLKCVEFHRLRRFERSDTIDFLLMRRCDRTDWVDPLLSGEEPIATARMPFNGPLTETDDPSLYLTNCLKCDRTELEVRLQCDLADNAILSIEFDRLAIRKLDELSESIVFDLTESSGTSEDKENRHQDSDDPSPSFTYFFQAIDGQRIYMHPINVKCLLKEYGRFEYCPRRLSGLPIVSLERKQVIHAIKRFIHLRHLPEGCEIKMAEVDLKGVVSDQALQCFEDRLRVRRIRELEEERRCRQYHRLAFDMEKLRLTEAFQDGSLPVEREVPCNEAFPPVGEPATDARVEWECSYAKMATNPGTHRQPGPLTGNLLSCLGGVTTKRTAKTNRRSGRSDKKRLEQSDET